MLTVRYDHNSKGIHSKMTPRKKKRTAICLSHKFVPAHPHGVRTQDATGRDYPIPNRVAREPHGAHSSNILVTGHRGKLRSIFLS